MIEKDNYSLPLYNEWELKCISLLFEKHGFKSREQIPGFLVFSLMTYKNMPVLVSVLFRVNGLDPLFFKDVCFFQHYNRLFRSLIHLEVAIE